MEINLSSQLQKLGTDRLKELQAKWPDIVFTETGKQVLLPLCSLSDFIFQSCYKYQGIVVIFAGLSCEEDLNHTPEFDPVDYSSCSETNFMTKLRQYRHLWFSLIAARDFLGLKSITDTMADVSFSADFFYAEARNWSKANLKPRWGIALDTNDEEVELIALGMGKLGGNELNFSSDIDLIFAYSEKGQTQQGRKSEDFQAYFTKLAQKIIHLLDTRTADGQVFRVDMRLRPFGDSGPLVSSFDALEDYYQEQGREWERYALLKARPLALSGISHAESKQQHILMTLLKPFVYRKYIDFSVIDSLRTMKKMIRQEVVRRGIKNNIKLGEGGIREIEFVVQALQLLRGGKEPQLQTPSLLTVLPELLNRGLFNETEIETLQQTYLFLRIVEQQLQAFSDQQTQTLPTERICQDRLVCLHRVENWSEFLLTLGSHTRAVSYIFNDFIGDPEEQSAEQLTEQKSDWLAIWNNDSATDNLPNLQWLLDIKLDFDNVSTGARGKEKLDVLLPMLIQECESQHVTKRGVRAIFNLVKRISSRTTYLELLLENEGARAQLIKLIQASPYIGEQLSKFPLLLDLLIDPKLLYQPPNVDDYFSELRRYLLRVEPDDLEQQMEGLRQFKLANQLIIAASDVEGVLKLTEVSDHLTALGQACLQYVVDIAWYQLKQRYGLPVGSTDQEKNFAIVAYGKMAGYELGYGSDIDLIFLHDCSTSAETDGKKPIDSRQFYIKLAQRIVHIFTTKMHSGVLYELDTRLRPSGQSGLLAINIDTFEQYQQQEAWTWEHQALVRSRFVCGDGHLKRRFDDIRHNIICHSRHYQNLAEEVASMREKMFVNLGKETEELFDLKQSRGGIADIEFISQFIVLKYAKDYPALLTYPDNLRIIETAKQHQLLTAKQAELLISAYVSYRRFYHMASINDEEKLISKHKVKNLAEQVLHIWSELGLAI